MSLCVFCEHAVPVMVTVEPFFSSGLPTVSHLFSYCLLPSSVCVVSCCHVCPCDVSFILIPTLRQLSAGLFGDTELAHMNFARKVSFQVNTKKD